MRTFAKKIGDKLYEVALMDSIPKGSKVTIGGHIYDVLEEQQTRIKIDRGLDGTQWVFKYNHEDASKMPVRVFHELLNPSYKDGEAVSEDYEVKFVKGPGPWHYSFLQSKTGVKFPIACESDLDRWIEKDVWNYRDFQVRQANKNGSPLLCNKGEIVGSSTIQVGAMMGTKVYHLRKGTNPQESYYESDVELLECCLPYPSDEQKKQNEFEEVWNKISEDLAEYLCSLRESEISVSHSELISWMKKRVKPIEE